MENQNISALFNDAGQRIGKLAETSAIQEAHAKRQANIAKKAVLKRKLEEAELSSLANEEDDETVFLRHQLTVQKSQPLESIRRQNAKSMTPSMSSMCACITASGRRCTQTGRRPIPGVSITVTDDNGDIIDIPLLACTPHHHTCRDNLDFRNYQRTVINENAQLAYNSGYLDKALELNRTRPVIDLPAPRPQPAPESRIQVRDNNYQVRVPPLSTSNMPTSTNGPTVEEMPDSPEWLEIDHTATGPTTTTITTSGPNRRILRSRANGPSLGRPDSRLALPPPTHSNNVDADLTLLDAYNTPMGDASPLI